MRDPLKLGIDPLGLIGTLDQLTGQDASYVFGENARAPLHIGAIAIYDPSTAPGGKVRFKDILRFFEAKVSQSETFRRKLLMVPFDADNPYWIDDPEFDIEFHVRHIALPQPGDWRQLMIQASRIHSRGLDMSKPLWEFWIIEGLDNIPNIPKGSFAVISKVHHSAVDGVSGVAIAEAVHKLTPEVEDLDAIVPVKVKRTHVPSDAEMLARAHINSLTKPLHGLELASRLAPGAKRLIDGLQKGELHVYNSEVPSTRFNAVVSGHRVLGGQSFDLAAVKSISRKLPGATVNDVVLTIVGGALRKYLSNKNELPTDSLTSMAPISVRSSAEKGALGNQVTALYVQLGTHVSDPMARLQYVHDDTRDSKAIADALGARQLSDASKLAPAMLAGAGARLFANLNLANHVRPMFNTVVSNVPGPQVPIFMNGSKLVTQVGLGPVFDGCGLFHSIYSYCGKLTIGFAACRKMMPDPELYDACIKESFEELEASAAKRKSPQPETSGAKVDGLNQTAKAKDDLTRIKGIGPKLEIQLNGIGVTRFAEIAGMTAEHVSQLDAAFDLKGRITRDAWIEQAKQLSAE